MTGEENNGHDFESICHASPDSTPHRALARGDLKHSFSELRVQNYNLGVRSREGEIVSSRKDASDDRGARRES